MSSEKFFSETYAKVSKLWDESIIPTLCDYIKIPNQSPSFDEEWATNGYLEQAVELLVKWVKSQNVPQLQIEVVKLEGRTPLIFMEVPASDPKCKETVLLYGHLDKQPPLTDSWKQGLGPYLPVIQDGKLFGRGGADDGYSTFAAVASINALKEQGIPHARCVVIIEACEESGSFDLPFYVDYLESRIGVPNLVICLDSGCGNYEQFWLTTSLRGMIVGTARCDILREGSHSGHASGIVPDSFRILRKLLSRIENEETGEIIPKEFHTQIPEDRVEQIKKCAASLGSSIHEEFPWVDGAGPVVTDCYHSLVNRTWKPQLAITGADGLPTTKQDGNVLRTHTTLKLSLRIPPMVEAKPASVFLKELIEKDPPYGSKVTFEIEKAGNGWNSPPLVKWLEESVNAASTGFYNKPANFIGEGGSIPFMGMLGRKFPAAQFVITGLLGPESNAHGPNEMLHIDMGKKVTCCVASILRDHYVQHAK